MNNSKLMKDEYFLLDSITYTIFGKGLDKFKKTPQIIKGILDNSRRYGDSVNALRIIDNSIDRVGDKDSLEGMLNGFLELEKAVSGHINSPTLRGLETRAQEYIEQHYFGNASIGGGNRTQINEETSPLYEKCLKHTEG